VPAVKDGGDGTYAVEYCVDHLASCSLHVSVDGHALPHMPVKLAVAGVGRAPTSLRTAGHTATATARARNYHGPQLVPVPVGS
jgi:hypothetical protein